MSMHYANETDARDPYTLPIILIQQFTAHEIAETMEDELYEFSKRHEFRLSSMNRRVSEKMLDAMVEELEIDGGYMWCVCFQGCLPDSSWYGPFRSHAEALQDARDIMGDCD